MIVIEYDPEADVLYVKLADIPDGAVHETRELDEGRLIDLDADGRALGVELLDASRGVTLDGLPQADAIRRALQRLSNVA